MHLEKAVVIFRFFPRAADSTNSFFIPSKSSRVWWEQGVLSVRYVPFHTEAVLQGHLRTTKQSYMRMRMHVQT